MNEIPYRGRHWLVAKVGVGQVIVLSLYIDVFLCRVSVKIQLCKSIVIAADCDDDAGYAARGELKAAELHVGTRNQDFVDAIEKYTSRCGRSDSDTVRADFDVTVKVLAIGQNNLVTSDSAVYLCLKTSNAVDIIGDGKSGWRKNCGEESCSYHADRNLWNDHVVVVVLFGGAWVLGLEIV